MVKQFAVEIACHPDYRHSLGIVGKSLRIDAHSAALTPRKFSGWSAARLSLASGAFLLISLANTSVSACDLNGKSFTYRFLWECTATYCARSYEKMAVVGDTIIVYDLVADPDHYDPSGQLYYLGKKVEVSSDNLQQKDEVLSVNPNLKERVFVSAAIVRGDIRTVWEQFYTLQSGGQVRLRIMHIRTLRVSPDCQHCELLEHSMVAGGVGAYGKKELTKSLSCTVGEAGN